MKTRLLISELLKGAYITQRPNRRKGFGYALYDANGNILTAVSNSRLSTFIPITKVNKGKITLNLNLVRQMHGKSLPKILYKKSKQKL